jgi:fumarylpyruvate hydrolase
MSRIEHSDAEYVFSPETTPKVPVKGSSAVFPVRRIYCVGSNYKEHAREMGTSLREPPCFFFEARKCCFHR